MRQTGILVVDFGSSAVRAAVFDPVDGRQLVFAAQKYVQEFVSPVIMELAPEMLWRKSMDAVAAALAAMDDRVTLIALSFSFLGDNVMAVDHNGNPLTNLILTSDRRGEYEAALLNERMGGAYRELTGEACSECCCSAKILWLRSNMRDVFDQTAKFWSVQSFIISKLGFADRTDYTMAARMVLFDTKRWQWAQPILNMVGISRDALSPVTDTGAVIGTTSRYGTVPLPGKVPVVLGGHDTAMGVLGVGVCNEEQAMLANVTGTYEHMAFLSRGYRNFATEEVDRALYAYCGPLPGSTLCVAYDRESGLRLERYLFENCGNTLRSSYEELWKRADFSERASGGQGALVPDKYDRFADLIRQLTRDSHEMLLECQRAMGSRVRAIRVGGGFTRSDQWMRLRADVFGIPVQRVVTEDASAMGAAVLAAASIGVYPSVAQAIQAMVRVRDTFEPSAKRNECEERQA